MKDKSIHNLFIDTLEELDFSWVDTDLPEIVFLNNIPENLHPKHYIALEFAAIFKADAVYFRYYDDNRYCVPQVYFYDNSITERTKIEIAEIHKQVYSSCQVPMICFVDKTAVSLFDCRMPVKKKGSNLSNDECVIKDVFSTEDLYSLKEFFSARKLNTSIFWESSEASKHFLNNTSAYEELVKALSRIRDDFRFFFKNQALFANNVDVSNDFADDLLFKCILIKYLEENGKENATTFYQSRNLKFNSLYDFLYNNQFVEVLEELEKHFNGNVFSIDNENKNVVRKLDLSSLAECLEGKFGRNSSLYIWEMYSFKHIPIELISNFYEEFIPKTKENKGTVYTPSYLVNLLIDECLPLSRNAKDLDYNIKLADVSCGSGIFITSAFKRLVQRWRVANMEGSELPVPKLEIVQNILTDNIFGVDIHPTAVKLSKFSLMLAICQLVPNKELWTYNWNDKDVFVDKKKKVFIDLDSNIIREDFFDFLTFEKYRNFHTSFSLIIGNPPFITIGENQYTKYCEKLKNIDFGFKVQIPKYELALMFLECSNVLLKDNADLCFIQKSTALLYNSNAKKFRDYFFDKFHVHQIIDFTLLKDVLFEKALVETCAVFYKKEHKSEYTTTHLVSRLLKNTKDGLFFEFDYYDFFEISKENILKEENIWRCNLLGGNRLNNLVKRLGQQDETKISLEKYIIKELKINRKNYLTGFKIGNESNNADFITKKPVLLAKNFKVKSMTFTNYDISKKFESPRHERLFQKPNLIIKSTIDSSYKFPVLINLDKDFAFDINIIGIAHDNTIELQELYQKLIKNEKLNCLKSLSTCAQFYLGSTSAIQKQDIDKWVIPLDGDEVKLSFAEKIVMDDVLDFVYPSWYKGEKAPINQLIPQDTTENTLLAFADIFNQSFNSIYKKGEKEQKLKKITISNTCFALEFCYGENVNYEGIVESEEDIDSIIKNNISRNAIVNRVLRIYTENTITLIKPKNLRYWLKSIALRDADEVFDDMINAGY